MIDYANLGCTMLISIFCKIYIFFSFKTDRMKLGCFRIKSAWRST